MVTSQKSSLSSPCEKGELGEGVGAYPRCWTPTVSKTRSLYS